MMHSAFCVPEHLAKAAKLSEFSECEQGAKIVRATRAGTAVVCKISSPIEAIAHSVVDRACPGVTAHLLDVLEWGEQTILVMEDLQSSGFTSFAHDLASATNLPDLQNVVATLARIHDAARKALDATQLGTQAQLPIKGAGFRPRDGFAEMVLLTATLVGASWAEEVLEHLTSLALGNADAENQWRTTPTLVHGDLHQNNFLVRSDGEVRILDWGEAGWSSPAWDLCQWPNQLIALYADLTGGRNEFWHDVRAAHRRRTFELLDRFVSQFWDNSVATDLPSQRRVATALMHSLRSLDDGSNDVAGAAAPGGGLTSRAPAQ